MSLLRYLGFMAEYFGARCLLFVAQALPLRTALRFGEQMGGLAGLFMPGRRGLAIDNLMKAFPHMSRDRAEAIALKTYRHFGRAAVESAVAHRLLRRSTFRSHLVIRGEEHLRKVIAEGNGAIIVGAHLGVWELFGLALRYIGAPPHVVYRPTKNPYLDRFIRRWRSAFGQTMVPRKGALRTLLRVLRRKGYITLLVDQHVRRDGIWVPFFGRPASTTPAPAALALVTGAPILVAYGCRLPGTYRFELFLDEPIRAEPTDDREADIKRITAEITRRIEGFVRLFPEQWLWLHRRWHTPPPEHMDKGTTNE